MKKMNIKIFERSLLFALVFSVLISFTKFDASCENMRKNILRIHIIANSDSEADQAVKLKVRDAVVAFTGEIFNGCESLNDAEKTAKEHLGEIKGECEKTLAKNGFSYPVNIKIGDAFFDTREYDSFTLPAGNYRSLIITLGEGKGHNWWCVVYPSVCLGGSKANIKKIGRESEIATNPKKYKIRFKLVEIYENMKRKPKRGK